MNSPVMNSAGMNSLGIDKAPAQTRVVVAMSGGVDSSVTAALLHEEGYEVIGVTLQLYDHGFALEKAGACCAGQDIYDARRVAETLGFPHYVLDYESRFQASVMDDFAEAYLRGETPIPCVRCNQSVKFRDLLATARELGADALATGHYIERREGVQGPELHRASDEGKDQSYFLFATTSEQLALLRFPLGAWPKSKTRALAEKFGLEIAHKPDSQDICFVPKGDYAAVVRKLRPEAKAPGPIVHVDDGRVLGQHEGVVGFTIGQRRGLGVGGFAEPLYVVDVRPQSREVVVGPKSALAKQTIYIKEQNWLASPVLGQSIQVKIRSAMAPVAATFVAQGTLRLDVPEYGVAPGQAAVAYDGTRLLGGGFIVGAELD